MKTTIVFADAEIEKSSERREIPLLDAYYHEGVEGRSGRPDIIHNALTLLRSSSIWEKIDVAICTKSGEVISPQKEFFVQNYIDFMSKIHDLLLGDQIEEYTLKKMKLKDYLVSLKADRIIVLSPDGGKVPIEDTLSNGHNVIIIGAFSEGDYISPVYDLCDVTVSLAEEILTVPEVVGKVINVLSEQ